MSEGIRYKLVIAYDGTNYAGWQIQPNGLAVQAVIEQAIEGITGEQVRLHGSGRTDQGVHARRQVAHCDLSKIITAASLKKGLNALLPEDVRIIAVSRVPSVFHARRSAKSKEYRYFIWNDEVMPPIYRYYKTHIRQPLDAQAMQAAAELLIGKNDFAAFTANPNRVVETTVRHLTGLAVKKKGSEIVIIARGEGFLYKMVRSLAGFLIRVGEGSVVPGEAAKVLKSRVRTARVPTAPPQGLFLWNVTY